MKGKAIFTRSEADPIIELIRKKLGADSVTQKRIRDKIRAIGFYASDFGLRGGYTVEDFLRVVKIIGGSPVPVNKAVDPKQILKSTLSKRKDSDESYVIDLCDKILNRKAVRQHRFDFLKGDSGIPLPVDAYYPELNLVIEYRERQHTEEVKFFNRRQTVSGVNRGEQRKIYDQRRRDELPAHGITLLEIGYEDFEHDRAKRLLRNTENDIKVLQAKLKGYINQRNHYFVNNLNCNNSRLRKIS